MPPLCSQTGLIAATSTAVASGIVTVGALFLWRRMHGSIKCYHQHSNRSSTDNDISAHEQLIEGGTPLVKLQRVSRMLGRSIYVKMESLNPGGTGKDRAALSMIREAEQQGQLPLPVWEHGSHHGKGSIDDLILYKQDPNKNLSDMEIQLDHMVVQAMTQKSARSGGLVVEGTSGSTGIALATLCAARGHACLVVLPDDQAAEKRTILRSLGAVVHVVPTAAISNPYHYVNLARKAAIMAQEQHGIEAAFINQFENCANFEIHYRQTGPEIWRQMRQNGQILDAFVMSSGTGGTIAGCGTYLKEQNNNIEIVLVDPLGSSLYNKVEHGVAYASQQQERGLQKHRYDTVAEGIGLDRVTENFALGLDCIDRSICVSDQEAVDMAHWILHTEGLWMGSSSAMNLVGAIRTALDLPEGACVATIMCDGGQRHATRFWDPTFVRNWGLQWPDGDCIPKCLQDMKCIE